MFRAVSCSLVFRTSPNWNTSLCRNSLVPVTELQNLQTDPFELNRRIHCSLPHCDTRWSLKNFTPVFSDENHGDYQCQRRGIEHWILPWERITFNCSWSSTDPCPTFFFTAFTERAWRAMLMTVPSLPAAGTSLQLHPCVSDCYTKPNTKMIYVSHAHWPRLRRTYLLVLSN